MQSCFPSALRLRGPRLKTLQYNCGAQVLLVTVPEGIVRLSFEDPRIVVVAERRELYICLSLESEGAGLLRPLLVDGVDDVGQEEVKMHPDKGFFSRRALGNLAQESGLQR